MQVPTSMGPMDAQIEAAIMACSVRGGDLGRQTIHVRGCSVEETALESYLTEIDLVTPEMALTNQALQDGSVIQTVTNNYATSKIQSIASQADVALVFVNANSGEGYISVDGN